MAAVFVPLQAVYRGQRLRRRLLSGMRGNTSDSVTDIVRRHSYRLRNGAAATIERVSSTGWMDVDRSCE